MHGVLLLHLPILLLGILAGWMSGPQVLGMSVVLSASFLYRFLRSNPLQNLFLVYFIGIYVNLAEGT